MPKPERRDPAKERYWRRMLRRWHRSGQTGRDFCAAQGLSEASFYAWRREIARRDREEKGPAEPATQPLVPSPTPRTPLPTFVRLMVDAATSVPPSLEVVVAHGRRVRVSPGFDAELLRQLLRVLEEPAC
jgi:hypothetical protein